ncbi:MAG: lasso peptide biosynthesis B2 protein [Cyanobacteria bacterium J06623_7]
MSLLRRFPRVRRGKKLFIQAYIVMCLVRLGLLALSFSRLQNLVLKSKRLTWLGIAKSEVHVGAIALAVHRSGKYSPGQPMCLAKALTAAVLMNIYGFPYQMHIGVAKSPGGKFEAHAWITWEGKVVVGKLPDLERYQPMAAKGKGLII